MRFYTLTAVLAAAGTLANTEPGVPQQVTTNAQLHRIALTPTALDVDSHTRRINLKIPSPRDDDGNRDGDEDGDDSRSHKGAIAGGVVGGVAALLIVLSLLYRFKVRKTRQDENTRDASASDKPRQMDGTAAVPAELPSPIDGRQPASLPEALRPGHEKGDRIVVVPLSSRRGLGE